MENLYSVSKEKGGMYYVHNGNNNPISGTFKKDKKDALHIAAKYTGVSYKEYLKLCKTLKQTN